MENKFFLCEHCNYKTNKLYNLKRHQNAIHNIIDNKTIKEENLIQKEENLIQKKENIIQKEENILYCSKCNKKYKTKKFLINHEEKCKGINSLTCPKCMKSFSSYGNKFNHIKKNNCKARSIIHADKSNTNINNITNNIINNNTNNIIINNYGSERTDFITFDDMLKIFRLSGNNIIPRYIELKHFNKDFPENHNIKCEKNNECFIKKNGEWKITDIEYLSKNLIINNSSELYQYYNKEKYKIENNIQNIDIIEFIKKRFNYLDLNMDRQIYNSIKNEIKDIIKSSKII